MTGIYAFSTQRLQTCNGMRQDMQQPSTLSKSGFLHPHVLIACNHARQEMRPDVAMLKAEILTETLSGERIIKYFPVSRLSKVPEQRFAQLFQARPRWELQDLEPFLQSLQVGAFLWVLGQLHLGQNAALSLMG